MAEDEDRPQRSSPDRQRLRSSSTLDHGSDDANKTGCGPESQISVSRFSNKRGCNPRSPRGCRPAAVGPPHRRVGAATPGRVPVFLVGRARQRQDDESGALSLGNVRDAMAIVIELRARAIRSPTVPSAHAKWWSTSLAAPPTKERARAPRNLARTRLAALGDVLHDRRVEHRRGPSLVGDEDIGRVRRWAVRADGRAASTAAVPTRW